MMNSQFLGDEIIAKWDGEHLRLSEQAHPETTLYLTPREVKTLVEFARANRIVRLP